jgi:predicted nucleic acid-binding protein
VARVACLDADVLHPWILCDLMLRLTDRGLFRAAWSERILDETIDSIHRSRPDLTEEQLRHRYDAMTEQFPEAMIDRPEPFETSVPGEVDPGDRHVVAAALAARANVIVTQNVPDFAPDAVARIGILVQHPDEFLVHQWWLDPTVVFAELEDMARATSRPSLTLDEILEGLARIAPSFAAVVRESSEYGKR